MVAISSTSRAGPAIVLIHNLQFVEERDTKETLLVEKKPCDRLDLVSLFNAGTFTNVVTKSSPIHSAW